MGLVGGCFSCAEQGGGIEPLEPLNVTLYDKDSTTIQHYIQGKWKVVYAERWQAAGEGIVTLQYYDDCFVEFTADSKFDGNCRNPYENRPYSWYKGKHSLISTTDSIFIMRPKQGISTYLFKEIRNDTLIFLGDYNFLIRQFENHYCIKENIF
jgi:hypothetical protein